MILDFTTHFPWNKKAETMFREKIVKGLMQESKTPEIYIKFQNDIHWLNALMITQQELLPKIHTIRRDAENRWKPGAFIDFFINAGKKKAHLFVPKSHIKVKSLQKITFTWTAKWEGYHVLETPVDRVCIIVIDNRIYGDAYFFKGKLISHTDRINALAINNGFNTVDEFFKWFKEDFSGKVIHWTNLKY